MFHDIVIWQPFYIYEIIENFQVCINIIEEYLSKTWVAKYHNFVHQQEIIINGN